MLTESFAVADRDVRWGRLGDGPPVVFCHGTPWSSALWQPIAEALSSEHTVYLWDARLRPSSGASCSTLPVQVVWGAEDTWIPVERAHRLTEAVPGARLHLVPDAGHLIQLDAPERLTAVLQRWLTR